MKRNPFLRVKLKSLAEEARIIRIEERRANEAGKYQLQSDLREHRVIIVRWNARATLLAYQFLRGVPYQVVECTDFWDHWERDPGLFKNVLKMAQRYGDWKLNIKEEDLKSWFAGKEVKKQAA